MTQLSFPATLTAGTPENVNDLNSNLNAIKTVINSLDNTNLSASAGIKDTQLASPNNPAYRNVVTFAGANTGHTTAASPYILLGTTTISLGSGVSAGQSAFYFDPADYAVAGKTTKYRLRVAFSTNATAPTSTFTFGLYPVSSVAGVANILTPTLGAVTAGSTVAFAAQAASTQAQGNSGDFAAPAAGYFMIAFALTVANQAANSAVGWAVQLQAHVV